MRNDGNRISNPPFASRQFHRTNSAHADKPFLLIGCSTVEVNNGGCAPRILGNVSGSEYTCILSHPGMNIPSHESRPETKRDKSEVKMFSPCKLLAREIKKEKVVSSRTLTSSSTQPLLYYNLLASFEHVVSSTLAGNIVQLDMSQRPLPSHIFPKVASHVIQIKSVLHGRIHTITRLPRNMPRGTTVPNEGCFVL